MSVGDFNMNTRATRPTEPLERQVRDLDAKVSAVQAQLDRIEKLLLAGRNNAG